MRSTGIVRGSSAARKRGYPRWKRRQRRTLFPPFFLSRNRLLDVDVESKRAQQRQRATPLSPLCCASKPPVARACAPRAVTGEFCTRPRGECEFAASWKKGGCYLSRLFFSRVASRPRAPPLQSPPSRPSLTVPALARGNRHLTSSPNYPRYPKFERSTPPSLSSEETVAKGKRKEGTGAGEGVAIHHDDSVDAPAPAPSPRRCSCSRPLRPLLGQRPPARRRGRPGLGDRKSVV